MSDIIHTGSGIQGGFSNFKHFWWGPDVGYQWLTGVPLDVPKYLIHYRGIGDEADDPHLLPAIGTQEWVFQPTSQV